MKASGDLATIIGWNVEVMSRQGKKLKPLTKYLQPAKPQTTQEQRDAESRALMRMFDRAIERQGGNNGDR